MMGSSKPGASNNGALFDKIIKDGRRQRSQELANTLLSSKHRRSAGPVPRKPSSPLTGGTLASRVGVKKISSTSRLNHHQPGSNQHKIRSAASTPTTPRLPSLASRISSPAAAGLCSIRPPKVVVAAHKTKASPKPKPNTLAARITNSVAATAGPKGTKFRNSVPPTNASNASGAQRNNGIRGASNNAPTKPSGKQTHKQSPQLIQSATQTRTPVAPKTMSRGTDSEFTIRGLAGPFAVIARNFAPGTTEADISSALSNVGGQVLSCKIIATDPDIIVEIVFASREGGERVISRFHNRTADGRTLQVYAKPGGYIAPTPCQAPAQVTDGTYGFTSSTITPHIRMFNTAPTGGLYSDDLMHGIRKGRGFQTGGWSSAW